MKRIYYALTNKIYNEGFNDGTKAGLEVAHRYILDLLKSQKHDTMVTSVNNTKPAKHDDKLCRLCQIVKTIEKSW